ncbi:MULTISPECIES: hypothetical protein [unclassified Cupriavidus]|uniref:hypothetical protein n=1 Tax=unclassified Cupriavidus TaxID=2640874 RepID=UPI00313D97CF
MPAEITHPWQRMSAHNVKRATMLWQTIQRGAESSGFSVCIEGNRTYVARDGFRMWARLIDPSAKAQDIVNARAQKRPSSLKLVFTGGWASARFEDKPGRPLEGQIREIWNRLSSAIRREVIEGKKFEASLSEMRAREATRLAKVAEASALENARKEEERVMAERRAQLILEADRWGQATRIRSYLAAVRAASAAADPEVACALSRWTTWAESVVLELDPLPGRVARIDEGEWKSEASTDPARPD